MTIVSLQAENVKRLTAIRIDAAGEPVVIIGGDNGAGKTSTLDCIEMALAGGSKIPSQPIRKGQRTAKIVLETEELVVERRFTASGTTLEVRGKDGAKLSSPQAVLDRLCTSIAFDPLEFVRLGTTAEGRRKQAAKLVELAGLNLSKFDTEKAKLVALRTEAKAKRDAYSSYAGTVTELGPKKSESQAENTLQLARNAQFTAKQKRADREAATKRQEDLMGEIAQLQELIRRKQAQYRELSEQIGDDEPEQEQERDFDAEVRKAETELAAVRQWNAKVDDAQREAKYVAQYREACAALDEIEGSLNDLADARVQAIASAKFPVKGLGLSDDGNPTFNGIPLEQCSSAENIRIGVAMAIAASPGMPVMLIRDGSLLDKKSLNLVADMAAEAGAQVWIERVGSGSECTVIIEDGEVKP